MSNKLSEGMIDENGISSDDEEAVHFRTVIKAFSLYYMDTLNQLEKEERDFFAMPIAHQKLVPTFLPRLKKLRQAAGINAKFINLFLEPHLGVLDSKNFQKGMYAPDSPMQQEKVQSTLGQFVREWSDVGKTEREKCYGPLLSALEQRFPDVSKRPRVRVLTPGAGLGRLTFEVARRGFTSQGNEFTYFMLVASNYAMNQFTTAEPHTFFPYIRNSLNLLSEKDRLFAVTVPDVDPGTELPPNSDLSMVAGDFLSIYSIQKERWDAIVCSFFLDTAHNVLEYLAVVAHALVRGGYLLSLGPLLYHYSEMPGEESVDLTWEEIAAALPAFGLRVEEMRVVDGVPYAHNTRSLLDISYKCIFFVAKKVDEPKIKPQFGNDEAEHQQQ